MNNSYLLTYFNAIVYPSFVLSCNTKHPDVAEKRENQREKDGECPGSFGKGLPEGTVDRMRSAQQKTCNPR